jgi:hypothetical protein
MASVFDQIKGVKQQVLLSDLPATVTATVMAASKTEKKGAYAGAPLLKIELCTDDNTTFSITYRIPKALTGKGQLDTLLSQLTKLKVKPEEIIGKRFEWQRITLEGAVQGNDRFYPVKLLGQKKL